MHNLENLLRRIEALKNQEAEVHTLLLAAGDSSSQRESEVQAALAAVQKNGTAAGQGPSANGAASRQTAYERIIAHIRQVVTTTLPAGSNVLIVSRGDDRLMIQDGRTPWHFPQTEKGIYAGHHPADSGEAIAHLEALRAKGAGYLIFPGTAFWWLEYYADFRRYLDAHYDCIRRDEYCVLYRLVADRPGDVTLKRLDALAAHVEAVANREAELRTLMADLQNQLRQREQAPPAKPGWLRRLFRRAARG